MDLPGLNALGQHAEVWRCKVVDMSPLRVSKSRIRNKERLDSTEKICMAEVQAQTINAHAHLCIVTAKKTGLYCQSQIRDRMRMVRYGKDVIGTGHMCLPVVGMQGSRPDSRQ